MNDFLQNLRGGQRDNRAAKTRRGFDSNTQQPNFNSSSHFHSNGTYQNPRAGSVKRPMRPNPQNPQNPMIADPSTLALPSDMIENIMIIAETMVRNQEFLTAAHERRAAAEERKADSLEEIAEYLRVLAVASPFDESLSANEVLGGQEYDQGYDQGYGLDAPVAKISADPESFQAPEQIEKPRVSQEPVVAAPVKKRRGRKPKALKLAEEREAAELERREAVEGREKTKIKVIKRTRAEKMKFAEGNEDGNVEIMSRAAVMDIVDTMRKNGATFDEVAQRLVALGQPTFSGRGEWHAQTVHRLCNTKKQTTGKK